jgi:hypothetical protein
MDVFSRTFLPATSEAGLTMPTVSRHMPILRRCIEHDDPAVLVARCVRPDRPLGREYLMVLTYRRLVLTQESWLTRRLRLHLNTELRHLGNIVWLPDQRLSAVEFAATAVDGIRERFLVKVNHPKQVWHLDALFSHVFKPRVLGVQRTDSMLSPVGAF